MLSESKSARPSRLAFREQPMGRWKSSVVMLGIAAFFIGFAAGITLLAPIYSITLQRLEDGVHARVEQRVLWWFPVRVQTAAQVSEVKVLTVQPDPGEPLPGRPSSETRHADTIGYLILTHPRGELKVMLMPADLPSAQSQVEDFLRAPKSSPDQPSELRIRAVANTIGSWIAPGILAGFGALVLLLYLWTVVSWLTATSPQSRK
jgi:hypothetical protein